MAREQTATRLPSWPEHLKNLDDHVLTELAADYCWLTEKNTPHEEREDFRKRREAILQECERRGLKEAAQSCRPSKGME